MRLDDRVEVVVEEKLWGSKAAQMSSTEKRADPRLEPERRRILARLAAILAELIRPESGEGPIDLEREAFIQLRNEEVPEWSSPLLALDTRDLLQARGRLVFRDLISVFRAHVHFPEEWEYDLAALYVFQCYLADLLPGYFYALIDGTKGAGKTTFLDHLSRLTDSLRLQSFTLATLSRSMTKFRPVSIDEFDITEKNPELGSATGALVRQGYKRDAAPRLICAPRSNEVLALEIAGPKAITFRYDLDDALKDRGFRFPMAAGSKFRFVVLGMAPEFGDIVARLRAWAAEAHRSWTFEAACSRIKEPSFEREVRSALGTASATRGAELMTTAILVGEIVGVKLTESLQAASGARERENASSRGVEELMDALRALAAQSGPQLVESGFFVVAQTAVRAEIDRVRKEGHLFPLKDGEFAQLRRDSLIHDDWRIKIHGTAHWKVPRDFLVPKAPGDTPDAPDTPSRQDDRVSRVARVRPPAPAPTEENGDGPAEPLTWQEPAVGSLASSRSGGDST